MNPRLGKNLSSACTNRLFSLIQWRTSTTRSTFFNNQTFAMKYWREYHILVYCTAVQYKVLYKISASKGLETRAFIAMAYVQRYFSLTGSGYKSW